jgi:hypothetical protein
LGYLPGLGVSPDGCREAFTWKGLMSALGQKRTSRNVRPMSALPPKADIRASFFARHTYRCAGGWVTLCHSPIESRIQGLGVTMAKGQMRSNREKKKPKQDKNKKKGAEASVKLGTSYASQYGKKH